MKKIFFALLSSILLFNSCEDTSDIGMSIIPPSDGINVTVDTFMLGSSTYIVPSVLAENDIYLLGEYEDSKYGHTRGAVLAQVMFPEENLTFPAGTVVDSMNLDVRFSAIAHNEGISFDIYQLKKQLVYRDKYYTDINTDEYVDFGTKLGSITLTEEFLADADTLIKGQGYASFNLNLGQAFAQKFMDESIYANRNTFLEFFKGVYIVPSDGSEKTILYASAIDLKLSYHYEEGEMTIYKMLDYPANNEVRQINSITHTGLDAILSAKADTVEYIYTPAGFFTEIDIPVKSIMERLTQSGDMIALNSAKFSVKIEEAEEDGLAMPTYLFLINKDSINTFFEKNKVPNGTTSFSARISSDNTYTFNLIYYMQKYINSYASNPAGSIDIEKMVLVPVKVTISSESSSITAAENMTYLSGMTLKNKNAKENALKLTIAYNQFFNANK